MMIRGGFLSGQERTDLVGLVRDGLAEHRAARRANALLLLDDGWSCEKVAGALYLDDDTIRHWRGLFETTGVSGLLRFESGGSVGFLKEAQESQLKVWIVQTLPRSTRVVGAYILKEFGVAYESRAGLIKLLHRLGLEYQKPEVIGRKLDVAKQKAFIEAYENLLKSLAPDEAVLFVDAVHPTHATRPVGCWTVKQDNLAIEQTSGRQRLNIHGAVDLETGQTRMIEAETIDALSTIRLLQSIEAIYPAMALIHVFLDNARYHHAKLVQEWLAQPGRRIKLHFVPAYCPHLNPIERLWGVMHKNITHNKCYATYKDFADATLGFLRQDVPKRWRKFRSAVTDNFRVIDPKKFRVVA
jgi:transposase